MQKIFRKNAIIIVTIAILILFALNTVVAVISLRNQQYRTFSNKLDQIIQTMKNNDTELDSINANLNVDYLTRAKATAYILEHNEEVFESVSQLKNLATLLDVDEIHVIDDKGYIIYSSVAQYIGLDFHDDDQTAEFLSILEDYDESNCYIQDERPNAAEGKEMKYVAVARRGQKGIVQVGLVPGRQVKETQRNTYEYIFSLFPTDEGEELFSIDCKKDVLTALSGGMPDAELQQRYTMERFADCSKGSIRKKQDGSYWYVVTREYKDTLIGASIPIRVVFRNLAYNIFMTLFCLVCVEVIILLLLNYLLKSKVINGIHEILRDLTRITGGNYDVTVTVGGNPEFEQLSKGINQMVQSVMNSSDRIAKIIELSGMPLVAFEYQPGWEHVYVTKGLKELLELSQDDVEYFYEDKHRFVQWLRDIMEHPIEKGSDTFQVNENKYVRIHLAEENGGYLGVVTDATKDVEERNRIHYENNHDQLTGLSRYQYFKQRAAGIIGAIQPGEMYAVVMMDLDAFKQINDNYGHDVGDRYLQSFAMMLASQPEEHFLPARRSGDEFCMLVHGYYTREQIKEQLEQFWLRLLKSNVQLSTDEWKAIRSSGGYICSTDSERDITELLHLADEALYDAKEHEKGFFREYGRKEEDKGE